MWPAVYLMVCPHGHPIHTLTNVPEEPYIQSERVKEYLALKSCFVSARGSRLRNVRGLWAER